MARVELLGPRELLAEALALLQASGALHLREAAPGLRRAAHDPRSAAQEDALRELARRASALADRLPPFAPASGPARAEGDPAARLPWLARLEGEVAHLEERRAALQAERAATERFSRLVVALAPLGHRLDPALEPELHGLELRTDPAALALLRAEVERLSAGACEVEARALDEERTGVLLVVPRACSRALSALLFERGVDEVRLPPAYGGKRLLDVLLLLLARVRAIPGELEAVDAALADLAAREGPAIAATALAAAAGLGRLRAAGRCAETRFAFVVTGYMPARAVEALRARAASALGERVAVFARPPARAEWAEVPVVLRNRPCLRPFERLLALVELPRYGSVDPTPWLAVFFPLFFGLVLGDVVFGVLGAGAALLVRARRVGAGTGRDLAWIALWCSVSAALFGLAYGEALGELGAGAGLHPLLLDRRRAVMTFLWVALGVGAVHVAAGIGLGVASALAAGHRREALGRAARFALLLAVGVGAAGLTGLLPGAVVRPALVSGTLALASAVVADGPMAALDLVLGLGNVLSYARLMALGLASAMLAEVANLLATSLRPAAAGVAIGVLLHAVNFTLGLISPTVAALRLHYVEFFEKFYEEGGVPYRPFALDG
jgi:V/A-type H+-transporting ATPase subunit I